MFKPVLFAVAMSLIVDVCGYKQAGKGKSLPANIKTIAVPVFQNSSLKYRVEQRFTQAVIDEILKRARALRVVTDSGQCRRRAQRRHSKLSSSRFDYSMIADARESGMFE